MMSEDEDDDEDDDEATVQPPTLAEYKSEKSDQVVLCGIELVYCGFRRI